MPATSDRGNGPSASQADSGGRDPEPGVEAQGARRAWLQGLYGYGFVVIAAVLWATLGLFYERLVTSGLPPITVVFFRAGMTSMILFIGQCAYRRGWPRLERRDLPLFISFGLVGIAAFWTTHVHAVALIGVGVAAVLMYTAPAWVTVLSAALFGERLSLSKAVAVVLAFAGCALVGRMYSSTDLRLNLFGILVGLGCGFGYGLYILFCKVAQRRYDAATTLAYAFGFGALFLLPLQQPDALVRGLTTPSILTWLLVLALVPSVGGGLAFTAALRRVPATDASVGATLEPAIATLLGWALLDEQLEHPQLLGAVLIITAVVMLQRGGRKSRRS